ncbi:Mnn14 protein [Maudiozyma humilis]|uniref:Mnn14 protein n=1 Tax=Maudiozyma humilis TaxID=51915 RepID=A0AAV5RTE8_MAUHU|nr:Mnn14 protein [Kazachstania humilis]
MTSRIRRAAHYVMGRLMCKNVQRNILIATAVYAFLSLVYLFRVSQYGADDTINQFMRPFLVVLPLPQSQAGSATKSARKVYPSSPLEAAELYRKLRYDTSGAWVDEYYLHSNLLTVPKGENRGKRLSSVDELQFYDSDPRLSWSVYLHNIMNNKEMHDYEMPFSWYDFADFRSYNRLVSIKQKYNDSINCHTLINPVFDKDTLQRWERAIGEELFQSERYKYNDPYWYRNAKSFSNKAVGNPDSVCASIYAPNDTRFSLPLNMTSYVERARPEVFQLQARNVLYNRVAHPISVTMLHSDKAAYRIHVKQDDRSNMVQSGILQEFIDSRTHGDETQDIKFDHDEMFKIFLNNRMAEKFKVNIPETDSSVYDNDEVHLSIEDFKFDAQHKIRMLRDMDPASLSPHDKNYLASLENSVATHPAMATKYFNECGGVIQFKSMGHHRDIRFFNGALIYNQIEYSARLNSMIRTFQKFLKANGLISWLSHGTLYSHLYNGVAFPWDNDFDLQMPISHLNYMAQYYNQSVIMEDPTEGNGKFLIDVGTSITVRTHGNGFNNIDARFIDIDSGLYIDITGISVTSDVIPVSKFSYYDENAALNLKNSSEIQKLSDKQKNDYVNSFSGLAKLTIEQLKEHVADNLGKFDVNQVDDIMKMYNNEVHSLPNSQVISKGLSEVQRYYFNEKLQMVNCRNWHFNTLDMISPLRLTQYHGVAAFVPNKVISSLKIEYTVLPQYGFSTYERHTFISKVNYWVQGTVLRIIRNTARDPSLFVIHSSLNDFRFNDLLSLLKNMLIAKELDTFTSIHNSFEATTYRQKEMEIEYDNNMHSMEKRMYLRELRRDYSPKIHSPSKDPLMLGYEQSLWDKYLKNSDELESEEIMAYVNENTLRARWKMYSKLYEGTLFKVEDHYLDNVGLSLFENSITEGREIFKHDAKFTD